MNIIVREDPALQAEEVVISCRKAGPQLLALVDVLRQEYKFIGEQNGKTHLVSPGDVYYFESVDKRTFLYTAGEVMQSPLRLYEIEQKLAGGSFFRASKSTVVNLNKVASLRPALAGRMEAKLNNGEYMLVSRQYVPILKQKLGL